MKKILLAGAVLTVFVPSFADVPMLVPEISGPVVMKQASSNELSEKATAVKTDLSMRAAIERADATTELTPRYEIPDGVFYLGQPVSKSVPGLSATYNDKEVRFLLGSPQASYTWKNATINGTESNKYTWTYLDVEATNANQQLTYGTVNTFDYVSDAGNAILTYDASTKESYNTYAPTLQVEGSSEVFGSKHRIQYGYSTDYETVYQGDNVLMYKPAYTWDVLSYVDEFGSNSYYMSFDGQHWVDALKQDAKCIGYGIPVPKPDATYGLKGIQLTALIKAVPANGIEATLYPMTADNKVDYANPIGGGKVSSDELVASSQYYQSVYIPMTINDPDFGDVSTVLNINEGIFVVISGPTDSNVVLAGYRSQKGTYANGNTYYVYEIEGGKIGTANLSGLGFGSGDQKYNWYNMDIAFDVTTSFIMLGADDVTVPVGGASGSLQVLSMYDLVDRVDASIYGDGLDDWYTVEFENGQATYLYNMKLTVKELPAGVAGRASYLHIFTPGSEAVVYIHQGEVTGIDSVGADAEVVASEYFDLMGRKLNGEPESGLFIRKDLKSDGTVTATKIVK